MTHGLYAALSFSVCGRPGSSGVIPVAASQCGSPIPRLRSTPALGVFVKCAQHSAGVQECDNQPSIMQQHIWQPQHAPFMPFHYPHFQKKICHCNSNYGYFSQKMADCFYSEVKPMGIKHEFSVCFFSGLNEEWQLPFQPKQLLPSVSSHI